MLRLLIENILDRKETIMNEQITTLASLTIDGKGSYGIGASAVPFSKDLYTYLRITDIKDDGTLNLQDLKSVDDVKASEYLLKPNDIVFARTGASTGRNYFYDGTDGEFVYAGFLIKFSIDEKKVNPKYIKYFCQSKQYKDWINSFNTGSTRGNINAQTLGKMPIPLIERKTQDALVSIISSIDEKIKKNNAINNNLEQQAQAIFKEWFIDNPENNEWSTGTFSELIKSTLNGDWGKEAPTGNNTEKVYCIRGPDIPEVKAGNKGKMPTRYILPKNYVAKQLTAGDIVVEISGGSPTQSTGRCTAITQSLLDRYDSGMVCTNFCKALKPKEGYSLFIYYYWQYMYGKGVFFSYENGTTGIKNLDFSGFIETETILIPPIDKITAFDNYCNSIFSQIFANGKQNEHLAVLRDTLLPKLMSGELDVSNIDL